MKICKRIHILLTCLMMPLVMSACGDKTGDLPNPVPEPDPDPDPVSEFNYVYEQGTAGYEVYRIPAIAKSKRGVLLAFAEARKLRSNGDTGDIDLVVKRSTDNGESWGNQIKIWDDGANTCGNPVPIVDDKGRIHLLMTWNHGEDKWSSLTNGTGKDTRRAYYCYSDDEGVTWSSPVEITDDIKDASWDWYGTGPVHGIQLQNGIHKGRLISPNYFTVRENGVVQDYAHMAYSDDYGITWKAGAPTPSGDVGECSVAELPDGRLLLNMRTSDGFYRKQSFSDDGGESWSDPVVMAMQLDAKCQGSLLAIDDALYLSHASAATRSNMTIRRSGDKGESWDDKLLVYSGNSGYSDMVQLSADKIALFYEGGKKRYTDGLDFKIITISSIK
ncbi:MAG: sialidase family protein [Proteiniphilum sp.]|nr:sialidase family protein [Proteiniphilum sp.]